MTDNYLNGHIPNLSPKGFAQEDLVIQRSKEEHWYNAYRQIILEMDALYPPLRRNERREKWVSLRAFLSKIWVVNWLFPPVPEVERQKWQILLRDARLACDCLETRRKEIESEHGETLVAMSRDRALQEEIEEEALTAKLATHNAVHDLAAWTGLSIPSCDTLVKIPSDRRRELLRREREKLQEAFLDYIQFLPFPSPNSLALASNLFSFLDPHIFAQWLGTREFLKNPADAIAIFLEEQGAQWVKGKILFKNGHIPSPPWMQLFAARAGGENLLQLLEDATKQQFSLEQEANEQQSHD